MYAARTGRDPVSELLRDWPPPGDSARLVAGTILRGMDALADPTAGELAAALQSDSDADRTGARRQLDDMIRRHGIPATDSLATELLRPLIDSIAARGGAPWPDADDRGTRLSSWMVGFHGVRDVPLFVLDENLPSAVAAALPSSFTLISQEEWSARPAREGGVLMKFQPTREWDGFVTAGMSWTVRERRAADEAPSGYAGGGTMTLLRTPSGWRVVASDGWIT
jgi:hypothetical protein